MPNWCANALKIQCGTTEVQNVVDSLFSGELVNRTDEISFKMRKVLLAGIAGILVPHTNTSVKLIEAAGKLHINLLTDRRESSERAIAYTQFLEQLVDGVLSLESYEILDSIYSKTGLGNCWWGDIPKSYRLKLKEEWKKCSFDYADLSNSDISRWWSKPNGIRNSSLENVLDLRILTDLPLKTMINGFNGNLLNCGSTYFLFCDVFGTKWPVFKVTLLENGNYSFDTAWSPISPINDLLPEFVANQLNIDLDKVFDESLVTSNLYFYEAGCAFQGINNETYSYSEEWDEDENEYISDLLPEIAQAFEF